MLIAKQLPRSLTLSHARTKQRIVLRPANFHNFFCYYFLAVVWACVRAFGNGKCNLAAASCCYSLNTQSLKNFASFLCQIAKFPVSLFFHNVICCQYHAHVEDAAATGTHQIHTVHNIQHLSCTKLSFSNVESKNGISHNNGIKTTIVSDAVCTSGYTDRYPGRQPASQPGTHRTCIEWTKKKRKKQNWELFILIFTMQTGRARFVETTWEFVRCPSVSRQSEN